MIPLTLSLIPPGDGRQANEGKLSTSPLRLAARASHSRFIKPSALTLTAVRTSRPDALTASLARGLSTAPAAHAPTRLRKLTTVTGPAGTKDVPNVTGVASFGGTVASTALPCASG